VIHSNLRAGWSRPAAGPGLGPAHSWPRRSRVLPPNRRAGAGGRTRQPPAGTFVTW